MGDRQARLAEAVAGLIEGGVAIDAASSAYETPPWGGIEQPDFLNAAVSGVTDLDARALLRLCKAIEAEAGRDFGAPRNSPRPIDVDILVIDGERVAEPDLEVPHAAMHTRGFVLVPLAEIAAEVVHPTLRRSVRALLEELPAEERAEIRRASGPEWARLGPGNASRG